MIRLGTRAPDAEKEAKLNALAALCSEEAKGISTREARERAKKIEAVARKLSEADQRRAAKGTKSVIVPWEDLTAAERQRFLTTAELVTEGLI
jgi:hypothetical protein